tara:strand:- start:61 stop:366 length:306 start_codon:yes stop_codon:yes gene_type:complete
MLTEHWRVWAGDRFIPPRKAMRSASIQGVGKDAKTARCRPHFSAGRDAGRLRQRVPVSDRDGGQRRRFRGAQARSLRRSKTDGGIASGSSEGLVLRLARTE